MNPAARSTSTRSAWARSLLALKLIREWLDRSRSAASCSPPAPPPATGGHRRRHRRTAGHLCAAGFPFDGAPLSQSLRAVANRVDRRRGMAASLFACRRRGIPVSPGQRPHVAALRPPLSKIRRMAAAALSMLDAVAIQEPEDAEIWETLGVTRTTHPPHRQSEVRSRQRRPARVDGRSSRKCSMPSGKTGRVILAASTHPGEDAWIAAAILDAAPMRCR